MAVSKLSTLSSVIYKTTVLAAFFMAASQAQAAGNDVPQLSGVWQFGSCSAGGGFDLGCMVLEEDDALLTDRAIAYRDAIDEIAQPKYDCAPMPIPHMWTDPYSYKLEQLEDRVLIYYGKDDVIRTVWLDGHGHEEPAINDFRYYGHSKGHYENGALVIVTSKFTFDPQGLNADFRIPSSTQKEVTERFSLNGKALVMEVSTVDTFFLKQPWSFKVTSQPSDAAWDGSWQCDLEASRQILKLMAPMYPNDPAIKRIDY